MIHIITKSNHLYGWKNHFREMSAPVRVSCNLRAVESDSGGSGRRTTETGDF